MERILISEAYLFTPFGEWPQGWLLAEGKQIRGLGPGRPPEFPPEFVSMRIEANGLMLLPGFIDLHVHGAMGYEVLDASPQGLREMACFYARHGVTGFLPSTWTATREAILASLEVVNETLGPVEGGAAVLGAHLEGPYLNPERCGAQNISWIRRAERSEALEFLDSGVVRLVALAPEFPENLWLVDECRRRGITVSAAHTSASYEQMQAAVQHGVSQVTHCFNAMTPLGHRAPGTVGAALSLPEIRCELIADNIHVHPAVQKILVAAKGPAGVILVTDAIRGAGLPEGDYAIDERTVSIKDGAVRLLDGTLAGSILTMDRAFKNIVQSTGRPVGELWPLSSLNAARSIGLSATKGSLEQGKDADLVLLDEAFEVRLTVVEGRVIWREGI